MMIELFRRIFFLLLYRINKLINNFYSRINGKMTLTQSLNVTTRFSRSFIYSDSASGSASGRDYRYLSYSRGANPRLEQSPILSMTEEREEGVVAQLTDRVASD